MSTSSCCFPSRLMGGSAWAKAAAPSKGKVTMETQVICILHVFPSPHPTSYLSHPNFKLIEPVTSWQNGDCRRFSCTQCVLLCFGADCCRLRSSGDQKHRERQPAKGRALHYCRWGTGYVAFAPELQIRWCCSWFWLWAVTLPQQQHLLHLRPTSKPATVSDGLSWDSINATPALGHPFARNSLKKK